MPLIKNLCLDFCLLLFRKNAKKSRVFIQGVVDFFSFLCFFLFFMLNVAKLLYVTLVLYFKETNVFDIKPI